MCHPHYKKLWLKNGRKKLKRLISKKTTLLILLCICIPAFSAINKWVKVNYQYPTFKMSRNADSFIRFTMVHRKFVKLAEKFEGTVKSFNVSGQIAGQELENPEVKFNVLDMDTDNNMRNDKMQKESLSCQKYPVITVSFGPKLKLGSQVAKGTITILGVNKPISLPITIQDKGDNYKAAGQTHVLLSALGIPKPNFISDAIASVDDRVDLTYQVVIAKSKVQN